MAFILFAHKPHPVWETFKLRYFSIGIIIVLTSCAGVSPSTWYHKAVNAQKVKELEREKEIESLVNDIKSEDFIKKQTAKEKLIKFGKYAQPQLIRAVYNGPAPLQIEAIRVLTSMQDPSLVEELIKIGKDTKNDAVLLEVIKGLGDFKDKGIQPALLYFWEQTDSFLVKTKIAFVMGELEDTRSVDLLAKTLSENLPSYLREEIIIALGKIGDKKILPVLTTNITFARDTEKILLLNVIAKIGDQTCVKPLVENILIANPVVFKYILTALGNITGEDFYITGESFEKTRNLTYQRWSRYLQEKSINQK
jgi:hypothetical protein